MLVCYFYSLSFLGLFLLIEFSLGNLGLIFLLLCMPACYWMLAVVSFTLLIAGFCGIPSNRVGFSSGT